MVLPDNKVPTGDSISVGTVTYKLKAPSDTWIHEMLLGVLYGYCDPSVWDNTYTEVTPFQAAEVFRQMWDSLQVSTDIGNVIMYAGPTLPADCLKCDGSFYSTTAYPDLFAVIGYSFGSPGPGNFYVPYMNGKIPLSSGVAASGTHFNLAQVGGEETHLLTDNEMPAHSHGFTGVNNGVINAGLEAIAINLFAVPDRTQNDGGSQPHNNMQPYVVLNFAIRYR